MYSAHNLQWKPEYPPPGCLSKVWWQGRGNGRYRKSEEGTGRKQASPRHDIPSPQAFRGHGFLLTHKVRMNEDSQARKETEMLEDRNGLRMKKG